MAVSTAIRTAEPTTETRALLSDLYTDFGIRMYSSSREPLSMGAFGLTDFSRHFSNAESQQMYKSQPFKEMSLYTVWNFASNLLRRAVTDKPTRWMLVSPNPKGLSNFDLLTVQQNAVLPQQVSLEDVQLRRLEANDFKAN